MNIELMSKFRRLTINIPVEMEQELRELHVDTIANTRKYISFSKFFTYLIQENLSEKKKQQWYSEHNCKVVKL